MSAKIDRWVVRLISVYILAASTLAFGKTTGGSIAVTDLTRDVRVRAERSWESAGGPLLRSVIGPASAPGLYVVGETVDYEITSTRSFAEVLHREYGLSLVLIASWKHFSVPAFDGLVIDRDGQVIANFSLKTLFSTNTPGYVGTSRGAFSRADEFSQLDSWLQLFKSHAQGDPRQSRLKDPEHYLFRDASARRSFERMRIAVSEMMSLFAPLSGRPTWVMVDATRIDLSERDLATAAIATANDPTRILFTLSPRSLITMSRGQAEFTPRRSCRLALAGNQ